MNDLQRHDLGTSLAPIQIVGVSTMSENLQGLVQKYHAFYEVSPYHVVTEEGHGSPHPTWHTVKAGFDVDVHGVSDEDELRLPPPVEYASGYTDLKKIAHVVSNLANECCIEVIPFPSTIFLQAREHSHAEAVIRIRISHYRGLDQPASLPEQHALEAIENELQKLGIKRR